LSEGPSDKVKRWVEDKNDRPDPESCGAGVIPRTVGLAEGEEDDKPLSAWPVDHSAAKPVIIIDSVKIHVNRLVINARIT
jgi:hypothetical protein